MPRKTSSRVQFKTSGPSPSPINPSETTKRERGAATALPDLSGDLKPSLNYGRDTFVLGHILTMLPLGLSAFFHFIAISTKIFKMYGDCTSTNMMGIFFYTINSLPQFYPCFILLSLPCL